MPGDLVLKKLLPTKKNPAHGKLGPNWEGPYIVSRVVRPGNYELQTEEGKVLQEIKEQELEEGGKRQRRKTERER